MYANDRAAYRAMACGIPRSECAKDHKLFVKLSIQQNGNDELLVEFDPAGNIIFALNFKAVIIVGVNAG